ncbi:MAG TPA: sulfatase [bacterium]|nr:sulfatase [bacterium]HQL64042.1 sulfatase [bacterium]
MRFRTAFILIALVWYSTAIVQAGRCVFLTLDTCRADRLSCYGSQTSKTPALDELAVKGVLFENALVTAPLTLPSHCSIFTGNLLSHHQVRDNAWYRLKSTVPTLAALLQKAGIQTGAVIAAFPLERRFGLARGFDFYDDAFAREGKKGDPWYGHRPARFERSGYEVTEVALEWLRENALSGKPFFLWVHYFDPHTPYEPPSPFKERFPDQPYDGEVEAMDDAIGRLLAGLKELGLIEDTLFVAVGDHGESLGEHGNNGHGWDLYQPGLRVPMMARLDGVIVPGRKIPDPVQPTDLYPTALEYFGVEPESTIDGKSLWKTLVEQAPVSAKPVYSETIYMERERKTPGEGIFCIVAGHWKLISNRKGRPIEFYNLEQDPGESKNLVTDKPSWEQAHGYAMHLLLLNYIKEAESEPGHAVEELDPETMEAMKTLGYLK